MNKLIYNLLFLITLLITVPIAMIIFSIYLTYTEVLAYALVLLIVLSLPIIIKFRKSPYLNSIVGLLITMPFYIVFVWIFDKDYNWASVHGVSVREVAYDHEVMANLFIIGIMSVGAFLISFYIYNIFFSKKHRNTLNLVDNKLYERFSNLRILFSYILLCISLVLCKMSARSYSVFQYEYGAYSDPPVSGGSYLIGYAIMIYLALLMSRGANIPFHFRLAFILTVMNELLFNQLLVGSRESIGLVISLFIIYYNYLMINNLKYKIKYIYVTVIIVVFIYLALGAFRNKFLGNSGGSGINLLSIFNNNPWVQSTLSVLGAADNIEEIYVGTLGFSYYYQLFVQIIPTFIRAYFDLNYLIDPFISVPGNWYQEYTGGGIYYPLVVFKSFGALIGFIFLILMFVILRLSERLRSSNILSRNLLYYMLIVSSFRWFWYGDIDLLRALQSWALVMIIDAGYNVLTYKPKAVIEIVDVVDL